MQTPSNYCNSHNFLSSILPSSVPCYKVNSYMIIGYHDHCLLLVNVLCYFNHLSLSVENKKSIRMAMDDIVEDVFSLDINEPTVRSTQGSHNLNTSTSMEG